MRLLLKILITVIYLSLIERNIVAQDYYTPIASYSFDNDSAVDEMVNSVINLYNQASLYNDSQRGSVLRFSAESKSYAVFNKKLLDSDSCSISFFFYWESNNASSWHQLFELHDPDTNNNLFFTPQNGWGNNMSSVISDNKEYSNYEALNARPIVKNTWLHVAITFADKLATIYVDGEEVSRGYIMFTPKSVQTNSLYLGGNPNRSNNYYMSARLDDIKIFNKSLSANQIQALARETQIPAPENNKTRWETAGNPIQIEIDITDKKQTIQNFGSSDGWNAERIGKYWPETKKEKLAELLFSSEKDAHGNPKGLGLSAWRFNIGAGTAEQEEASRITQEWRRTECFLNADGKNYNWNKQAGQQWFLKQAAVNYNINHIIGWQNSPPVLYTDNNLGFREYGAAMSTILKQEYFDDFARFLAEVSKHFKNEGIKIDYISPLNEPQYAWAPSEVGGNVSQEGTPWTNQEIHDVVVAIDNEFTKQNIDTKLFISEAGSISYHTGGTGHASNQLDNFWNQNSTLSLVGTPSFSNIVSYHSYWKDFGSALVSERKTFLDQSLQLDPVPMAWQTEYSLLGGGYRDGYADGYVLTEMECALSLSKVLMADLNVANTTGWQWWSTFGQGKHGGESRFALIEALTKNDNSDGDYHLNKLFYTLGNFSHFIRPGMKRVSYTRSDNLTISEETSDIIYSVYTDDNEKKLVLVGANYTNEAIESKILLKGVGDKRLQNAQLYLTDEFVNLSKQEFDFSSNNLIVPAHSVITYTADISSNISANSFLKVPEFKAYYNKINNDIIVRFKENSSLKEIRLYNTTGNLLSVNPISKGLREMTIRSSHLVQGVYLLAGIDGVNVSTTKVMVSSH
ncbi:glycoside hydrolase [Saccharicrinis sp. GN24d3]|uniref:glycoside hydrolase n=1 Tax=Saccharicrinis sp. GN24d3 TaxID=3458416 RepID=UPI004035A2D2